MRRTLAVLLTVPALASTACGGSSDADQIKGVINDVADKPSTLCEKSTDRILKQVGGSKATCKKVASQQKSSKKPDKIDVSVDGDKATAKFKDSNSSNTVGFVKDGGDWKIDTVK